MNLKLPRLPTLREIERWRCLRAFRAQRAVWYEDLARAQSDGIALAEYLQKSVEREVQYGSRRVAVVLRMILSRLPSMDFHEALDGILPATDCMIIASAERSGALPANLRFLADTTRREQRMRATVRAAIAAPLVPAAIAIYILWYTTGMLPLIAEIVPPEKWTGAGTALRLLAEFTTRYGLLVAVAIPALAIYGQHQLPRWTGSRRRAADEWLLSLYRDYQGSLFATAFASLLKAGVGQKEALALIREQAIPWVRWHCDTIANRMVRYADTPGVAFDTGILPRSVTNRIIDLAERGKDMDEVMATIASTIIVETEDRLGTVSERLGFVVEALAGLLLVVISVGTTGIAGSASIVAGTP